MDTFPKSSTVNGADVGLEFISVDADEVVIFRDLIVAKIVSRRLDPNLSSTSSAFRFHSRHSSLLPGVITGGSIGLPPILIHDTYSV